MRHLATIPTLASLLMFPLWSACGEETSASEATETQAAVTTSERPVAAGCLEFCEKSNACARAEGRSVPRTASDCEASCQEDEVYGRTPELAFVCAEEECGEAFRRCTRETLMRHMRSAEVAVFPPTCVGLCNRAARCAERARDPLPPGSGDCAAACEGVGPYADIPPREHLCAVYPCGDDYRACRERGGPPPGEPPPSP